MEENFPLEYGKTYNLSLSLSPPIEVIYLGCHTSGKYIFPHLLAMKSSSDKRELRIYGFKGEDLILDGAWRIKHVEPGRTLEGKEKDYVLNLVKSKKKH
jgi:hypothetical protein